MVKTMSTRAVKEADEVWISTALLHRENPDREDFTLIEIRDRAKQEGLTEEFRSGVYRHAREHCVSNFPPAAGKTRMLYATGRLTRRLYRDGDGCHPDRQNYRSYPNRDDIPNRYHELIDWYVSEYAKGTPGNGEADSILELVGLGRGLWADENPDDYVRRLREE